MRKRLSRGLIFSIVAYLGIVVLFVMLEAALMYPAPHVSEGDWNPSWLNYEEAWVTTDAGNKVHGWFCEHPDPRTVILFCHGNGEHVAFLADELEFLRERYQASVLAFDYRGYGKSLGKPFETGILEDGAAAHCWLSERTGVAPESILLWGRSLGGAVAIDVAAKQGARGIVLDRTFNSMVDVASSHYPWLPVRTFLSNRYPSQDRIQRFDGPLLQFHGRVDEVIPFRCAEKLFEVAPSTQKQFVVSETMTHNVPWPEEYYDTVSEFIDSLPALSDQSSMAE